MLKMLFHIERLLWIHNCVIVPDFGGFVLQNVPAGMNDETLSFHPVQREIVFNPSLTHNDGLLTESYMQTDEIEYEEAAEKLKEDIQQLTRELSLHRKVTFGKMGTFTRSESGSLVFEPTQEHGLFAANSYGLPVFNLLSIKDIVQEKATVPETYEEPKKANRKVFYLPINRTLIQVAGAAAAAVALFLLMSPPVKDVNPGTYEASIIPRSAVHKIQETTSSIAESIPNLRQLAEQKAPTNEQAGNTESQSTLTSVPVGKERTYFVIIGSFVTEDQANRHISSMGLQERFAQIGIVNRDNKVRVFAQSFTDKSEAETYLQTLRTQPDFESAWLFGSR